MSAEHIFNMCYSEDGHMTTDSLHVLLTPCEQLGYKEGDRFTLAPDVNDYEEGLILELTLDEEDWCPRFIDASSGKIYYEFVWDVIKIEE